MPLTVTVTKGYDWKQGEYYSAAKLNVLDQVAVTGAGSLDVPTTFPSYATASLPSAATYPYSFAFVTDATLTAITGLGLAPVGGGANKVPVFSDGTGWKII